MIEIKSSIINHHSSLQNPPLIEGPLGRRRPRRPLAQLLDARLVARVVRQELRRLPPAHSPRPGPVGGGAAQDPGRPPPAAPPPPPLPNPPRRVGVAPGEGH